MYLCSWEKLEKERRQLLPTPNPYLSWPQTKTASMTHIHLFRRQKVNAGCPGVQALHFSLSFPAEECLDSHTGKGVRKIPAGNSGKMSPQGCSSHPVRISCGQQGKAGWGEKRGIGSDRHWAAFWWPNINPVATLTHSAVAKINVFWRWVLPVLTTGRNSQQVHMRDKHGSGNCTTEVKGGKQAVVVT